MWKLTTVLIIAASLSSCGDDSRPGLSVGQEAAIRDMGDRITASVQATLLQQVSEAIREGGAAFAVTYCNTRAVPLTDSMGDHHQVLIQRLSNKIRNPENAIKSAADMDAWEKLAAGEAEFIIPNEQGDVLYYKPIITGMPTCLKCHGSNAEIDEKTRHIINQKYPGDKAVNYKLGDLRGMWKITFDGQQIIEHEQ